jgi:hypothetical protein
MVGGTGRGLVVVVNGATGYCSGRRHGAGLGRAFSGVVVGGGTVSGRRQHLPEEWLLSPFACTGLRRTCAINIELAQCSLEGVARLESMTV